MRGVSNWDIVAGTRGCYLVFDRQFHQPHHPWSPSWYFSSLFNSLR
jgi:hypothetical protein